MKTIIFLVCFLMLYRIPVSEIVKIKTDYQIQDKDIRTFRFTEDNCYASSVKCIKISQRSLENHSPLNESFTIIGKTTGFKDSTRLYLRKAESGSLLINQDSAFVINNSFIFRGKISEPQQYMIHTG